MQHDIFNILNDEIISEIAGYILYQQQERIGRLNQVWILENCCEYDEEFDFENY